MVDRNPVAASAVRFVVAAAVLAASTLVAGAQPEPVRGIVTDRHGQPLAGVEVELRTPDAADPVERATTDREGAFRLTADEIRPGRELHLRRTGFTELVLPLTAQHLVVSRIELTMTREVAIGAEPAQLDDKPAGRADPGTVELMGDQRRRAIVTYNEGLTKYEKGDRTNDEALQEEGVQLLRESAALDPTFAESHRLLARLAVKHRNWAEASRYAEDLLRIEPDDSEAIRTLYLSLIVSRHHIRIVDAAKRLITADPNSIDTVEEHARTFFANGNYVMARALYQALAEVSDDRANASLNLGICSAALGDVEATRSAYETFLELAPDNHPDLETVKKDLAALE